MPTKDPLDAALRAKALARWEGEGGALAHAPASDSIDEVPENRERVPRERSLLPMATRT
jgi:hypothetical protein